MDRFVKGYISAALCYLNDGRDNAKYTISDLRPETITWMEEDCRKFQKQASELLTSVIDEFKGSLMNYSLEKAGSDFWSIRHKDGFGYLSAPELRQRDRIALAEIGKDFGPVELYLVW